MADRNKKRKRDGRGSHPGLDHRLLMPTRAVPVGERLSVAIGSAQPAGNGVALSRFGVSSAALIDAYERSGIRALYSWQSDCLLQHGAAALRGRSLVYSSPTSSGKTLVAELLLLQRLRFSAGVAKAIFCVPFVSLVVEKVRWLRHVWASLGITIAGYYNNIGGNTLDGIDVAVCTIERANGLMNTLQSTGRMHELVFLCIDELHMAAEASRGCFLELMISKALLHSASSSGGGGGIQLVCMSATLLNLAQLAQWMGGDHFCGSERPSELSESVVMGGVEYAKKGLEPVRVFMSVAADSSSSNSSRAVPSVVLVSVKGAGARTTSATTTSSFPSSSAESASSSSPSLSTVGGTLPIARASPPAAASSSSTVARSAVPPSLVDSVDRVVAALVIEVMLAGGSSLVFCSTKKKCSDLALCIARAIRSDPRCKALISAKKDTRAHLLANLRNEARSLIAEDKLEETVPSGVAMHHAGLSTRTRECIEVAYHSLEISCFVATSTLAAGVNFPATRVIFAGIDSWSTGGVQLVSTASSSSSFAPSYLSTLQYNQSGGRAGRWAPGSVVTVLPPSAAPQSKLVFPSTTAVATALQGNGNHCAASTGRMASSSVSARGTRSSASPRLAVSAPSAARRTMGQMDPNAASSVRSKGSAGSCLNTSSNSSGLSTAAATLRPVLVPAQPITMGNEFHNRGAVDDTAKVAVMAGISSSSPVIHSTNPSPSSVRIALSNGGVVVEDAAVSSCRRRYALRGEAPATNALHSIHDVLACLLYGPLPVLHSSLTTELEKWGAASNVTSSSSSSSVEPPQPLSSDCVWAEPLASSSSLILPAHGPSSTESHHVCIVEPSGSAVSSDASSCRSSSTTPSASAAPAASTSLDSLSRAATRASAASAVTATAPAAAADADPWESDIKLLGSVVHRALLELVCYGAIPSHTPDVMRRVALSTLAGFHASVSSGETGWTQQLQRVLDRFDEAITLMCSRGLLINVPVSSPTTSSSLSSLSSFEAADALSHPSSTVLEPTLLGRAAYETGLSPGEALSIAVELDEVRSSGLILEGHLHALYFLSPIRTDRRVSEYEAKKWLSDLFNGDKPADKDGRVAHALGLAPRRAASAATTPKLKRLYSAHILWAIVHCGGGGGMPQFGLSGGECQSRKADAATHAGQVLALCRILRWDELRIALSAAAELLDQRAAPELSPFLMLGVDLPRAKLIHAWFPTLTALASASPEDVARVISKSREFTRAGGGGGEALSQQLPQRMQPLASSAFNLSNGTSSASATPSVATSASVEGSSLSIRGHSWVQRSYEHACGLVEDARIALLSARA